MTKPLVQGQIGYWANGKLVRMPKKHTGTNSDQKANTHIKRNRERRWALIARQRRQKTLAQLKLRQNIPQSLIVKLKNVSKKGDIAAIWNQFRELHASTNSRYEEHTTNFFRLWTRYIFVPDDEERTALYYASLTGHHHIVELYMSLYVMSAIQISETTVGASRTFRGWFSSMGGTNKMRLSKNFTLEDYDVCVLNGLNQDVRHVLTRKKLTISDVMNVVKKAINIGVYSQNSVFKSIGVRMANITLDVDRMRKFLRANKSKKHKKPVLNNRIFEGGDKDDNNHLWVIEEDDDDAYNGINLEYDTNDDGTNTTNEQEVAQDIMNKVEKRENTNLSIASSHIIDEQGFFEMKNALEDLDSISNFTILNDAHSIDYSQISLIELCGGDDNEEATQEWDVVSDLQSVKSMDTFMTTTTKPSLSYRDILLKQKKSIISYGGVANEAPRNAHPIINKELKSTDEVKIAIAEGAVDNDDEMCDAYWERDGFKNGRGGKLGRLFLGNSRSQNYGKWAKMYYGDPSADRRRDLQMRCRKMTNLAHNHYSSPLLVA